jgi:tetratricopeptide (TPR) repeat protein
MRLRPMRIRLLAVIALVCSPALAGHLSAQRDAECATLDCPDAAPRARQNDPFLPQAWQAAAGSHQRKLIFVAALQRFIRAQAGAFGDEAAELAASVGAMRAALTQWDDAIRDVEVMLAARPAGADIHVVRATVYLDRHRVDDAVHELREAGRLDAERVDVHTLQALAFDLAGRPSDALRALRRAADRDDGNPVIAYSLAQRAFESGEAAEASRALVRLSRALSQPPARSPATAATTIAPFERVGLLRQPPDVAPIFALASYADGYAALSRGDFVSALARFEAAAAQDPMARGASEARAVVVRGAASLRAGQVRAAIRILDDGVRQWPEHAETHRILSLAYRIDEQWDRAVEHASAAARLGPDERTRLGLAEALLSADRPDDAARVLEAVTVDWPRSGAAHYRLGELHERGGRVEAALAAYRRACDLEPIVGRDHLYLTIARLAANQADFDRAAAAHAARIGINPNHAEAHRQLAEIYFLQGRHDEALAEFSVAVWLDRGNARAHAGRGQIYIRAREYTDAIAAFERALALGAEDAETYYGLGTALVRAGRRADGEIQLATSARLRSAAAESGQRAFRVDALRREASDHLREGRVEAALARYRDVLEAASGEARSHRDVGLTLAAAGKPAEAVPFLEAAQAEDPVADAALVLAEAYGALGKVVEREQQLVRHAELVDRRKLARLKSLAGTP